MTALTLKCLVMLTSLVSCLGMNEAHPDPDVCEPHFPHAVLNNRTPKAASTSLRTLSLSLQKQNKFKHVSSRVYDDRDWFTEAEEEKNVERINEIFEHNRMVVYDQHIRYLNFSKFGWHPPVYINMVRDPAARLVSTYYYGRTGRRSLHNNIREKVGEQADWDINTCVSERPDECSWMQRPAWRFNLMTMMFCGHAPECANVTAKALQTAKHNLENVYFFVGLAEHYEESVQVFEKLLPDFYRGATAKLHSQADLSVQNAHSKADPRPTEATKAKLEHLARLDVLLYKHAVHLFDRKLRACGIQ
eukprot:TRINITY_DN12135_c0_g1_i1.p1 TRINITY_DN12135_c0_g1~~TRINITY_DN12135_c0_g1_i1.p1  ORF type:complete len:304 (+),score=66.48 TRINITY_DN12135_c0_g1_i1:109-1020(+)